MEQSKYKPGFLEQVNCVSSLTSSRPLVYISFKFGTVLILQSNTAVRGCSDHVFIVCPVCVLLLHRCKTLCFCASAFVLESSSDCPVDHVPLRKYLQGVVWLRINGA